MSTQIKNKDEQTNTLKMNKLTHQKEEKNVMQLHSNPHRLSSKDSLLAIRLSRNCDIFHS